MRILVSDGGCLIDLRKASLLDAFLKLPYKIVIPNTLFEDSLLRLTNAQKNALIRGGLKVIDLPGERVLRAQRIVRDTPQLSIHDGFAFALAESYEGCILLSSGGPIRTLATAHDMKVRGVLWVIEKIHRHRLRTATSLHAALLLLANDPSVRLPRRKLAASIKRYDGLR